MSLQPNQLTALDTLCWQPGLLSHCTACGARLPVVPGPRCRGCGGTCEAVVGTWQITDDASGRSMAQAWVACHGHVCRTDLAALWQTLEKVLRARYGFAEER